MADAGSASAGGLHNQTASPHVEAFSRALARRLCLSLALGSHRRRRTCAAHPVRIGKERERGSSCARVVNG
eukprot:6213578-Pleurochrysis_carterae.AAC.3